MNILEFSSMFKDKPVALHINPVGLLRVGRTNDVRFSRFNDLLCQVESLGGNIAIPVYSYSYAKRETYTIDDTPSDLDVVSEFLRVQNKPRRTSDGNFSYLLFGKNFSKRHFEINTDYASFGSGSLIEEIYEKNGYLGAIGGVIEYFTEIHYIEWLLNIDYRFDKNFTGQTVDLNGRRTETNLIYFCRDLSADYSVSFVRLKQDIKKAGLVKKIKLENPKLSIEIVSFKELHHFVEKKLQEDKKYLWSIL
ncbi:AAC(3) family N-acetyltransferase [Oceanospirillum beijerinckii]|uniref:AAC(3) family N-acetyltransferase n=1 Tax=Oceanospirillum beijerinckii TaxID=64976 RepID=UPI00040BB82B|nr:AAC(3) family N-acetyltransferase [Oceanospirillum beijerinckii]